MAGFPQGRALRAPACATTPPRYGARTACQPRRRGGAEARPAAVCECGRPYPSLADPPRARTECSMVPVPACGPARRRTDAPQRAVGGRKLRRRAAPAAQPNLFAAREAGEAGLGPWAPSRAAWNCPNSGWHGCWLRGYRRQEADGRKLPGRHEVDGRKLSARAAGLRLQAQRRFTKYFALRQAVLRARMSVKSTCSWPSGFTAVYTFRTIPVGSMTNVVRFQYIVPL